MKAIIIAAGMGTRLQHLTGDAPKCLLPVCGKSILQHQLDAFRHNGITDISLIKGYKKEKIQVPQLKYYINDNYEKNNILNSLMYAETEMDGAFIASYSDIVFHPSIVQKLMACPADIAIAVDSDWQKKYDGRTHHPPEEAEKVAFNQEHVLLETGKVMTRKVTGEFLGMVKCSGRGAEIFKAYFKKAKQEFMGKPFITAKVFDKAYITDFLQYLTNEGVPVTCVPIDRGWTEIDTEQDLHRASSILAGGGVR